jgi:hypothetical protein
MRSGELSFGKEEGQKKYHLIEWEKIWKSKKKVA